ncbi:MAG: hypothetical protein ABIH99_03345 [Candidatus Micrarchaeota archaeon]
MAAPIQKTAKQKILVLAPTRPGITVHEVIKSANKFGRMLPLSEFFSRAEEIQKIDKKEGVDTSKFTWTGTLFICGAPNKSLGARFRIVDKKRGLVLCAVLPREFRKEKNALLVVNQDASIAPVFSIEYTSSKKYVRLLIESASLTLLENYPNKSGVYSISNKFSIPMGALDNANSANNSMLIRSKTPLISLAAYSAPNGKPPCVSLTENPFSTYGALAEQELPKEENGSHRINEKNPYSRHNIGYRISEY